MKKIKAFLLGILEFKRNSTTHFDDEPLLNWYDRGRELAHRLTFRIYDEI